VVELLNQRLKDLQGQQDFLASAQERLRSTGVEAKYWIDMDYQQTMLHAEIGWIRSLQDKLGSGQLAW
jgi:hypothetical protein